MSLKGKKRNRKKKMENDKNDQKENNRQSAGPEEEQKVNGEQAAKGPEPEGKESAAEPQQESPRSESGTGELSEPVQQEEAAVSGTDALNKRVEQLAKEAATFKDRWLRAEADMDNYKKRVHKEKLEQLKYGYETLIRELLPVVDNLERAIEYSKKHSQKDSLYEGVELTLKLLKKVIEGYGVTSVQTLGEIFDPNFHEGLGVEESENYEDNVIVKEIEKGYIYNDRLLRPAKVIVGKKAAAEAVPEEQKN